MWFLRLLRTDGLVCSGAGSASDFSFSAGCRGSDAEDSAGGSDSSGAVGSAGLTSLISMPDVSSAVTVLPGTDSAGGFG